MLRNEYLALRRPYEPENIRLVIIAESPPASGLYFYKAGRTGEPLFAAMMKQLGLSPTTKEDGLREFQQRGWVLVDATYEPINKLGPDLNRDRDGMIDRAYPLLCADLVSLMPDRLTPLVLIKANVCRILKPKLEQDRFRVLNGDIVIPFPAFGQQKRFHETFGPVVRSAIFDPFAAPSQWPTDDHPSPWSCTVSRL
jgi:hypothetical protein